MRAGRGWAWREREPASADGCPARSSARRPDGSDVKEADVLRVALDERATLLDVLAHQDREHLVGPRGVLQGDLQQDRGCPDPWWCPTADQDSSRRDPCNAGSRSPWAAACLPRLRPAAARPARRRCRPAHAGALLQLILNSGGWARYTCPASINGRMKRNINVSSRVRMWAPSTSASAIMTIL